MKITISYHNVLRKKDDSLAQMMVLIRLGFDSTEVYRRILHRFNFDYDLVLVVLVDVGLDVAQHTFIGATFHQYFRLIRIPLSVPLAINLK